MSLDSLFSKLVSDLPREPIASTQLTVRAGAIEEDLARKTLELTQIEVTLADQELFLANLRAELAVFRVRYLREVGSLYAQLDDWSDQLASWLSKNAVEEESAYDYQSWDARICELAGELPHKETPPLGRKADVFGSVDSSLEDDNSNQRFQTPASLKSLYREVAKRVHPDLATDESDRRMRERLMKRANDAYQSGDLEALRQILKEYENSPESIQGSDFASRLARISRQITQGNARLSQIDREIEKLTNSDIGRLKSRSDAAFAVGEDLLAQMAADLRGRIEMARRELSLRSKEKKKG